jgi:multidrug efflux pump subunit AcrA (membrane-fusion protein)
MRADEDFRLLRKANQLDVRLGEIAVRVAELERKQANGADKDRQEILDLRLEQARLELDRTRAQARARERQAEADLQAATALARKEAEQRGDLEEQLKLCVLRAPREGVVILEQEPVGRGAQPLVAQGEPVREGQKLLQIVDLKNLLVTVKVPESYVFRVKVGQPATLRVDAFPDRLLHGKVTSVATVPAQQDWLAADLKVYPTKVTINLADLEGLNLKPAMSAEVRLVIDERQRVVQVPVSAVVWPQRARFVFVKTPAGLEERPVTTGINNNLVVEIRDGLKEGEFVLRQPEAVLRRLDLRSDQGKVPPREEGKGGPSRPTAILLQSIKPPMAKETRTLVEAYGITSEDVDRLNTIPTVTTVLPMRVFPTEVVRLEKKAVSRVVATTPDFARSAGTKLAAGRFVLEGDSTEQRLVAVLGSDLARELFPFEDPVGKTVVLNKFSFEVIGILEEQTARFAGLDSGTLNQAVYLPLPTCQVRFGERIMTREAGVRKVEAVPISAVVVQVNEIDQVRPVAAAIRAILEKAHPRKDWEMVLPEGR